MTASTALMTESKSEVSHYMNPSASGTQAFQVPDFSAMIQQKELVTETWQDVFKRQKDELVNAFAQSLFNEIIILLSRQLNPENTFFPIPRQNCPFVQDATLEMDEIALALPHRMPLQIFHTGLLSQNSIVTIWLQQRGSLRREDHKKALNNELSQCIEPINQRISQLFEEMKQTSGNKDIVYEGRKQSFRPILEFKVYFNDPTAKEETVFARFTRSLSLSSSASKPEEQKDSINNLT